MPMIHCNFIKDVFTAKEKRQVIENITEALVKVKGEGIRDLCMVMVHEVASGDVGKGGHTLTADDVKNRLTVGV